MLRFERLSTLFLISLVVCTVCYAIDINTDPTPGEYFFAKNVGVLLDEQVKSFTPDEKQANFTAFKGVEDVSVEADKIAFILTEKAATLGWGNYMGAQPVQDIVDTCQDSMIVKLKLSQSKGDSQWTMHFWRDGRQESRISKSELKGMESQVITFPMVLLAGARPDGLEFTITGEPGARITIEWLKIIQPTYQGYCRKEFVLPEGKIWRAVANVGSMNYRNWYGTREMISRLYLNGKEVKRRGSTEIYHTDAVDIAPYLKPGKNCVGFYGFRIQYQPFLYIQAKIIMESGEVITLASSPDWNYSPDEEQGWSQPGFDDSKWIQAISGQGGINIKKRDASGRIGIPAYNGRLVIENPERNDLFYNDTNEIKVKVRVPRGLKAKNPVLSYQFGKADAGGYCTVVSEGKGDSFTETDGSLIYSFNLGQQERGIYALALSLAGDDGVIIEERHREPMVVLRKKALKAIKGESFTEGLDYELESVIDFSGEVEPSQGSARLVSQDGLVYREVDSEERGIGYSYPFQFKHPGDFYYLELEYPDNAKRVIETEILRGGRIEDGPGAETGGRFFISGKMLNLKWIHVADSGEHTINIINAKNEEPAAAKLMRIFHIKGELPSVGSGNERNFGIHTERCTGSSGLGRNFGASMSRDISKEGEESLMRSAISSLYTMAETGERYVQYLKFTGQNVHIMGCIQYSEYNTPFMAAPIVKDSRVIQCMKTMMANLFDMNDIDFYAGVEFSQSRDIKSYANNSMVAHGADSVYMINDKGQQRYSFGGVSLLQNWLHPDTMTKFDELMEALADTYGHLPSFRGVHGMLGPTFGRHGYWMPGFGQGSDYNNPFIFSFDDVTINLFEGDTGIKLPIDSTDPERFSKRAAILKTPEFRQRFLDWRGEKVTQFFARAIEILRRKRPDLTYANALMEDDTTFFENMLDTNRSFKAIMKDLSIDMDGMNAVDGLTIGRWTTSWRQKTLGRLMSSQDPFLWMARTDPRVISAFEGGKERYVFVRSSWDENHYLGKIVRAMPQPKGYFAREAFIQAIITADPDLLIGGWTDTQINVGSEHIIREIIKPLTYLPKDKFTPVLDTGLKTSLAIRKLTKGNESWLYVANPGFWGIKGSVAVETDGVIQELLSKNPVSNQTNEGGKVIPIDLAPFGMTAYHIGSANFEVKSYEVEPIEAEMQAHLTRIIDRVEELLDGEISSQGLSTPDREFMRQSIASARTAIAELNYGLAWSLVTDTPFWLNWKDFLEEAIDGLATLPETVIQEPQGDDVNQLPSLLAHRTEEPIAIDGKPDEAAWEKAPYTTGFWIVTVKGKKSMVETGVKALHNDDTLYLAFACADRDPAALKADADAESRVYASKDDVLAFFIQPDEGKPLYYQMAFNAKGMKFDQQVKGGNRSYGFAPDWQTAVSQHDGYWTAEVALPYAAFDLEGAQTEWRVNFLRQVRNGMAASSGWSYVAGKAWHAPDKFGYLKFE